MLVTFLNHPKYAFKDPGHTMDPGCNMDLGYTIDPECAMDPGSTINPGYK